MARQAYTPVAARCGIVLLPRRTLCRYTAVDRRTDGPVKRPAARWRALRSLHALHERLSDGRHRGPLPRRPITGNRIYGCDDCQLVCPWNTFAQMATCDDFDVRNGLDDAHLVDLFAWSADEFNRRFAVSAIRRIGHERWLRNIAVVLGNALRSLLSSAWRDEVTGALRRRMDDSSARVREDIAWALEAA